MTEIKTKWDLKVALEYIIKAIDESQGVFSSINSDEKHNIEWFAKALEERRNEAAKALDDHYERLEKAVYERLEKIEALRAKIGSAIKLEESLRLPTYELKQFNELAEILERISRIDDRAFSMAASAMELSRDSKAKEAANA